MNTTLTLPRKKNNSLKDKSVAIQKLQKSNSDIRLKMQQGPDCLTQFQGAIHAIRFSAFHAALTSWMSFWRAVSSGYALKIC